VRVGTESQRPMKVWGAEHPPRRVALKIEAGTQGGRATPSRCSWFGYGRKGREKKKEGGIRLRTVGTRVRPRTPRAKAPVSKAP